jgi:hypothetical protein
VHASAAKIPAKIPPQKIFFPLLARLSGDFENFLLTSAGVPVYTYTISKRTTANADRKQEVKTMTNAQIIEANKQELAKQGILKYTGRTFKAINATGEEITVKEVEEIHTFAAWKELGYSVKKGEHAVAKFTIWKCKVKAESMTAKNQDGEDVTISQNSKNMFMKTSHWFTAAQVEPLKDKKTA